MIQLVNTGIPDELLERVKKVCSDIYKLREDGFKESNPTVKALARLVEQEGEGLAMKKIEDMDWEDVFTLQDDLPWPSNPPAFKETMMEYRRELKKLAEKLLGVMEELLGLEEGHIRKVFTNDGDFEPFYGTKDDRFGGLQMLPNHGGGGRWVDVQPVENAIVVNTGDQIEVLSNGRFKSAWHRILATRDGNRRSIASFYNPARMANIAPVIPTASGDADYPSFKFGDYMEVYVKQKFQAKEPRFEALATK
ncbi:hypothetical protein E2562_001900 [Oryza meyeriana var. granulata]|uniref:Isopenicillin N synthase-like Fe(2+) 2OG dioxygenase domain-containing protein n=1 Tax=Oryza meyeriana var. granulata TaxID=110450 RepID=A0A6G1C3K3_9ORYZ|nr:hypothetical protein E2562_001900 [Oryza meyeriana var. granulata]